MFVRESEGVCEREREGQRYRARAKSGPHVCAIGKRQIFFFSFLKRWVGTLVNIVKQLHELL